MNELEKVDPLPPVRSAVPLADLHGEDAEDTLLLKEMADMAIRYVRSNKWCLLLKNGYFGDGIGGVIGIFLFRVAIRGFNGDQWVWVFMGDIPSAYLSVGCYTNPRVALEKYIEGLEEWANAAEQGRSLIDLIPIDLPPTPEIIAKTRQTSASLREFILPNIRND